MTTPLLTDLLNTLDRRLSLDDLQSADPADLKKLESILFHWHALANRELTKRREMSKDLS